MSPPAHHDVPSISALCLVIIIVITIQVTSVSRLTKKFTLQGIAHLQMATASFVTFSTSLKIHFHFTFRSCRGSSLVAVGSWFLLEEAKWTDAFCERQ